MTTPASATGARMVLVRNSDGQIGLLPDAFTYLPPGGSADMAALSCKAIHDAGLRESGLYWLDPNGPPTTDAFQTWCDLVHAGGGWALAFNLDTNDGAMRSYSDTLFWLGPASVGTPSAALTADFRSAAYTAVAAKEVLIFAHVEGVAYGAPAAWARYDLVSAHANKTFVQLLALAANTTITG